MKTNKEKIEILEKLQKLNFKHNFGRRWLRGLCILYLKLEPNQQTPMILERDIPELYDNRDKKESDLLWWKVEGRFIPWFHRHLAIRKTIKQLKKT